jgi:Skp family chaperone for outer membrane proteins
MKKVFTCALLLASIAIAAQTTEKKQAKVRIKKVENINGVETITDTTYITDDPSSIKVAEGTIDIIGEGKDGKVERVVIINDLNENDDSKHVKTFISSAPGSKAEYDKCIAEYQKLGKEYQKHAKEYQRLTKELNKETSTEKILALQEQAKEQEKLAKEFEKRAKEEELLAKQVEKAVKEMDAEIQKAMKEAGVDPNTKGVRKMIIVDEDDLPSKDGNTQKHMTKIVMVRLDIKDASKEDVKRLKEQLGSVDNKVEMENMKLYPNPNDGKFNLNFNLKNKGDAEVTVYDMQGKQVYNEKLPNFTGEYNKPIDISSNAKGIYFVKIQQGKHTQVKKISLD